MAKGGTYLTSFQEFKMPADKLAAFERTVEAVKVGQTKVPLNAAVPIGD
jgi:hypothetical protein